MLHDRNTVWTTQDGEQVKVKDLTTRHLKNIIMMLERSHGKSVQHYNDWHIIDHSEWLGILKMEIKYREELSHLSLEELIKYFLGQKGWLVGDDDKTLD